MSAPRVVLVTGASSGIGRAVAHELAERGEHLVLASRSESTLKEVADECDARGFGGLSPLSALGRESFGADRVRREDRTACASRKSRQAAPSSMAVRR